VNEVHDLEKQHRGTRKAMLKVKQFTIARTSINVNYFSMLLVYY